MAIAVIGSHGERGIEATRIIDAAARVSRRHDDIEASVSAHKRDAILEFATLILADCLAAEWDDSHLCPRVDLPAPIEGA
jgi:hypothetical protein